MSAFEVQAVVELPKADTEQPRLFGLMAEFEGHEQLVDAVQKAFAEGYRKMDAYSPFPVEGLAEALRLPPSPVPLITLAGGIIGGLGGYFMQWFAMGRLYPLNVGGRPLHSWPQFIPVTFELTILVASFSAFVSVFVLNRLPQPNHPVFNRPEFERASIDRFFLCIEVDDPKFELAGTKGFLRSLKPQAVMEVEA